MVFGNSNFDMGALIKAAHEDPNIRASCEEILSDRISSLDSEISSLVNDVNACRSEVSELEHAARELQHSNEVSQVSNVTCSVPAIWKLGVCCLLLLICILTPLAYVAGKRR